MKTWYDPLPMEAYSNLAGRILAKAGRLVLWQISKEQGESCKPFWLVMIRDFSEEVDRPRLIEITGSRWGNGTERFVRLKEARNRFTELSAHPGYALEAEKALKLRYQRQQQALARIAEGKLKPFGRAT